MLSYTEQESTHKTFKHIEKQHIIPKNDSHHYFIIKKSKQNIFLKYEYMNRHNTHNILFIILVKNNCMEILKYRNQNHSVEIYFNIYEKEYSEKIYNNIIFYDIDQYILLKLQLQIENDMKFINEQYNLQYNKSENYINFLDEFNKIFKLNSNNPDQQYDKKIKNLKN
jgi:hypothetical protein